MWYFNISVLFHSSSAPARTSDTNFWVEWTEDGGRFSWKTGERQWRKKWRKSMNEWWGSCSGWNIFVGKLREKGNNDAQFFSGTFLGVHLSILEIFDFIKGRVLRIKVKRKIMFIKFMRLGCLTFRQMTELLGICF